VAEFQKKCTPSQFLEHAFPSIGSWGRPKRQKKTLPNRKDGGNGKILKIFPRNNLGDGRGFLSPGLGYKENGFLAKKKIAR
jgi:hypothetical protein